MITFKIGHFEIAYLHQKEFMENINGGRFVSFTRQNNEFCINICGKRQIIICHSRPSNNAWQEKSDEFHRRLEEGY